MTKKILSLVLAMLLCLSLIVAVSAEALLGSMVTTGSRYGSAIADNADLLSDWEEDQLQDQLQAISDQYGAQIAVVTEAYTYGGNIDWMVKQIYDDGDYGYGADRAGVLLLVCMDYREHRILSNGFAAHAILPGDIDAISNAIVNDLSDGDYWDAFDEFAQQCEYYLDGYVNGFPFETGKNLLIAVIIGLVIGLIVASILKGQLQSVRRQDLADSYVKQGSMHLTQSGDYFMYRNITRTEKQQNSSSSRSGASRNVGGGRF